MGTNPIAFAPAAGDRSKRLAGHRIGDHSGYWASILHQPGTHGEFRDMADEGAGAVNRVDHPHPRTGKAARVVGRLLGEPAVLGAGTGQTVLEQGIDRQIGLGHRVVGRLLPHLGAVLEI